MHPSIGRLSPSAPSHHDLFSAVYSAAGAVDRNHGGKSCSPQPSNRIDAEGCVLPHTRTAWAIAAASRLLGIVMVIAN
jgi:hypothetical protein